ncbi:MAG: N-acetylmuramoyl-L-alanine amidase [Verrucomicrobiota bacterium]
MILSLTVSPTAFAAPAATWDVTKIDGHDYVSVESVKRFYGFSEMSRSGATVRLKRGVRFSDPEKEKLNKDKELVMEFKVGGNDCLMNDVKFVFSETIASVGDKVYVSRMDLAKLIDPVIRPNFIQNAGDFTTVVLDPGHGGKDPGATNPFGTEADYNLTVANLVKAELVKKGFKVVMTRNSNVYLTLQERVQLANAIKDNAIYISIHFNSGGRSARGIETFTLSPPGVSHYGSDFKASDNQTRAGNEHDSANIALAAAVHGWTLKRLGTNTLDRGIKRARFSVLSGVSHPAILLEGGFMSHPYEARMIENPEYQKAIASGVVFAIDRYRKVVGRKPTAASQN